MTDVNRSFHVVDSVTDQVFIYPHDEHRKRAEAGHGTAPQDKRPSETRQGSLLLPEPRRKGPCPDREQLAGHPVLVGSGLIAKLRKSPDRSALWRYSGKGRLPASWRAAYDRLRRQGCGARRKPGALPALDPAPATPARDPALCALVEVVGPLLHDGAALLEEIVARVRLHRLRALDVREFEPSTCARHSSESPWSISWLRAQSLKLERNPCRVASMPAPRSAAWCFTAVVRFVSSASTVDTGLSFARCSRTAAQRSTASMWVPHGTRGGMLAGHGQGPQHIVHRRRADLVDGDVAELRQHVGLHPGLPVPDVVGWPDCGFGAGHERGYGTGYEQQCMANLSCI